MRNRYIINVWHPRWVVPYGCTCPSQKVPRTIYHCKVCKETESTWLAMIFAVSNDVRCTYCGMPCSGYPVCRDMLSPGLGSTMHAVMSHGTPYVCGGCYIRQKYKIT
jgi:hypothetical protein